MFTYQHASRVLLVHVFDTFFLRMDHRHCLHLVTEKNAQNYQLNSLGKVNLMDLNYEIIETHQHALGA